MSADQGAIDARLAAALRGDAVTVAHADEDALNARISYHGVAGLLRDAPTGLAGWPAAVARHIADEATVQAMWELRHRQMLNELLAALAAAGVVAILLKGTAVAYDLYSTPATRSRGDSDLLVDPADLAATRRIFARLGFERDHDNEETDAFSLQEVWSKTCQGAMDHHIDLHWHTLNCPALEQVLPVAECAAHRIALPRLGPDAWAMDRVRTLVHTCIHRTLNFTSPYFIGTRTYYGGDRLIWLNDIDLLARAFSAAEWDAFVRLASDKGVAAACGDGLRRAQELLATPVPATVPAALAAASTASRPALYLEAHQLGRAWQDLRAMPGVKRKYHYLVARALPSADFVRDKYPRQAGFPLPLLYARRLFDLFRARPSESPER